MQIEYRFFLDDGRDLAFVVDVDRPYRPVQGGEAAPAWTRLAHCRCVNCPLDPAEYPHCPAALDLDRVVSSFQKIPANTRANIQVNTPDREYAKRAPVEEGVRSLVGLIMATSACPVFQELKPNARTHLPFANREEQVLRLASLYLMKQYLVWRDGKDPDWDLRGVVKEHQELQQVNQAFWKRLMSVYEGDANSRALLSFFSVSADVAKSLDEQLARMKNVFYSSHEA
ncbi:hypothetical protein EV700_1660 [Fluviicoccus keumensis]|uniref:Uncharacterized protein n=1 Tax=Fluviicoccus keumensis TaxID=1435465 RepID=A0A4Q7Z5D7_9GAMM|nr:hypothetical protein [Fluviicoccus keumensis]RZU44859.1 hypothetical protein EV700_1660 [Fluviicoccus keumensis]